MNPVLGDRLGTEPVPVHRPGAWARLKPWLRGEPLNVPSHAMFVHFPAALLPASLAFDLLGRITGDAAFATGAAVLLAFGLAGGVLAAGTGLLDWLEMLPGARRSRVTRHLLVQVMAVVLFLVSLGIRLAGPDPATTLAPPAALAASLVGTIVMLAGNHLGGLLVYRDGNRVRSGR